MFFVQELKIPKLYPYHLVIEIAKLLKLQKIKLFYNMSERTRKFLLYVHFIKTKTKNL